MSIADFAFHARYKTSQQLPRLLFRSFNVYILFLKCQSVLGYIAKCVSKPEKRAETYKRIMQRVLPSVNSNNPILSAVSKLMNEFVGERHWSSQEVCHLLLDLP
ncbi:hypothetical protein V8E54_002731 [Elaphomyces granulatus]